MKKENVADRLASQMDFILEVDKIKKITRQTFLSDGSHKENDAEHSWHLALMTILLSEYSNQKIDVLKTVKMVLIHDIVEIDAGDTYAYDSTGNESKREREVAAADRIFNILPHDQAKDLRDTWEEFEEAKTPEALFALAMDKVQPVMLNDASGGISWREHGVNKEQIVKRNELTGKGCAAAWEYALGLINQNVEKGNIKDGE